MDVKLGLGLATGMFYHAPAGTALPTDPTAAIPNTWTHVGDVSDAGITLALNKTATNLKNWANKIKRVIMTDHSETIQAPIMDTVEEALKTVVGASNVTTASGVITVNLSDGDLPEQEAFLWVMKDGDDMMMIGCSYGQVSAVDNVTFAPGAAINWTPTITAMGDDGFKLIMKEA
ncbi:MAG: hypothetical protein IKE02_05840 [Lachnospiraceae bacterium]|nr:hypothetical protein [Lachnospiraceae bacterium]